MKTVVLALLFYLCSLLSLDSRSGPWFARPARAEIIDWTGHDGSERCVVNDVATIQGLECVFRNILQIVFPVAGVIALIMIVGGGFAHLTSGGNPKTVGKAWSMITFGVVGLVLIVGSWIILNFLSKFLGIPEITIFRIPGGAD